jgi:two-component system, sensor histidine kinase
VTREVRLMGAAGYRTFIVSATPLVRGDAVKWLGACADIEPQKVLAAQKDAQARQKAFFLNALSHDLRAPLNVVALNAHLLKLSAREDEQLELANAIVESAVAAGDLVANLLDFSKMGAHVVNACDPVSTDSLLQQIVRRFVPLAEKKGLYIRASDDRDLHLVTDRAKLDRVLSNLVDNAIKYTERGGIALNAEAVAEGIRIRVIDTGIGVPEQSIPHLFDEFYQVNNQERDRSKGFGMGLAICQSLARQIEGEVRLASTGPGGSCFEVTVRQRLSDWLGRSQASMTDQRSRNDSGVCSV